MVSVLTTDNVSLRKSHRNSSTLKRLIFIFLVLTLCLSVRAQDECKDDDEECNASSSIKLPKFRYISGDKISFEELAEGGIAIDYDLSAEVEDNIDSIRLFRCGCGKDKENRAVVKPKRVFVENGALLGLYTLIWPEGDHISAVIDRDSVFNGKVREKLEDGDIDTINRNDDRQPVFGDLKGKVDVSIISLNSAKQYEKVAGDDKFPPALVIPFELATNPLERLEYVKLIGLLFDKTDDTNKTFERIAEEYNKIKKVAKNNALARPSVFFNYPRLKDDGFDEDIPFKDNFEWEQPIKNSVLKSFVDDAQAAHRLGGGDDEKSVQLNYDQILKNYKSAKFLLNAGNPENITSERDMEGFVNEKVNDDVKGDEDNNFGSIIAKKLTASWCQNVYSDQKRSKEGVSISDIDEGGIARPDLVLTDFVKILHPEIQHEVLKNKNLTYLYQYVADNEQITGNVPCSHTPLRVPKKEQNKEERIFVDQEYLIPDAADRFRIEDSDYEGGITNEIRKTLDSREIQDVDLELIFPADPRGVENVLLILRAELPKSQEQNYKDVLPDLRFSMRSAIGLTVNPTARPTPTPSNTPSPSPTPTTKPPDPRLEDGGGISGGAIAGIVIVVLLVVAVLLFYLVKRRGRTPTPAGISNGNEDWADDGGDAGDAAPGGSQRRRLFGGRSRQQPIGTIPEETPQSDSPFDI